MTSQQPEGRIGEVHFPMDDPVPGGEGLYGEYPWVESGENFVEELEDDEAAEVTEWDVGGTWRRDAGDGWNYVFYLTGTDRERVIDTARQLAALGGMPAGAYMLWNTSDPLELGVGTRVQLS